jgi:hypothetical protein
MESEPGLRMRSGKGNRMMASSVLDEWGKEREKDVES